MSRKFSQNQEWNCGEDEYFFFLSFQAFSKLATEDCSSASSLESTSLFSNFDEHLKIFLTNSLITSGGRLNSQSFLFILPWKCRKQCKCKASGKAVEKEFTTAASISLPKHLKCSNSLHLPTRDEAKKC